MYFHKRHVHTQHTHKQFPGIMPNPKAPDCSRNTFIIASFKQARREDPTALRLRAVLLDEEGRPDERVADGSAP